MAEETPERDRPINPDMTVLEVVSRHRETEAVFRAYDEQAGVCLCCNALFDTIRAVSEQYGLDMEALISDLESVRTGTHGLPPGISERP